MNSMVRLRKTIEKNCTTKKAMTNIPEKLLQSYVNHLIRPI